MSFFYGLTPQSMKSSLGTNYVLDYLIGNTRLGVKCSESRGKTRVTRSNFEKNLTQSHKSYSKEKVNAYQRRKRE